MPEVVRLSCSNHAVGRAASFLWCRTRRFLEDSSDSRGTKMQAGAAQHLGDLDLAQHWEESLKTLHGMTDEIWQLVDGLTDLHERIGTLFVNAFHPRYNGGRCYQKHVACPLRAPSARSSRMDIRSVGA